MPKLLCKVCGLVFEEHPDARIPHMWKGQCPRCARSSTEEIEEPPAPFVQRPMG